ncbi:GNAT family N-acetyltransferase [Actinoalloteichus caeruleus]|uniref:Acetyltransferase (GNAT) family protein n=1 Tax=Actinoalloteichus caeruleus DSM 43889 TaxID=1120930 RepID=A0ABT1JJ16_ACTCY|nr:GNAT family N-acetyltransferase [Actinoalloteichus caeruleus]MCP2332297.1 Acetyltransferase (GNAT) family protein [Actinoalloteichus caeruleus DSM 43889]
MRERVVEELCADAWPAVTEERVLGWRFRAAAGFTLRANSGMPGAEAAEVSRVAPLLLAFAGTHGIVPRAQVVLGDPVEAGLRAFGWRPDHDSETLVLSGPLAALAGGARTSGAPPRPEGVPSRLVSVGGGRSHAVGVSGPPAAGPAHRVHLAPPGPAWWELTAGTGAPGAAERAVLAPARRGDHVVGFGASTVDGVPVAAVRGQVVGARGNRWLHVARLAVRPEHRRTGLARALVGALAGWAADRGAEHCVLQVTEGNRAARRLYEGLGCAEHHRYRYWSPG